MQFKEQEIIGKADAALMSRCRFKTVQGTAKYQGHSTTVSRVGDQGLSGPVITSRGHLIMMEESFGEGIDGVKVKLQICDGSVTAAEITFPTTHKQACEQWTDFVKSSIPKIKTTLIERGQ
jgi:hypothetical protein